MKRTVPRYGCDTNRQLLVKDVSIALDISENQVTQLLVCGGGGCGINQLLVKDASIALNIPENQVTQ